jgi:uracil-DNA glycosylase family 4
MLSKPLSCKGCPLELLGEGFMQPDGRGTSGVALVGEALGEDEADSGKPFQGRAGNLLNNALTRAGIDRGSLTILNAIQCRPPENKLLGKPYFQPALSHCKFKHLDPQLRAAKPKVIVALGGIPLLSLAEQGGILDARGYVIWSSRYGAWIMPTVHPSYVIRGNYNYEAILIHDLQRAMEISQVGYRPKWGTYLLDPTPSEALTWAKRAITSPYPISADIETPRKGANEEAASLDDESYHILRISFSSTPYEGMSIPWRPEYMAAIRLLLESDKEKVWWNGAYDIPRIQFNGVLVNGYSHDGMVAWHVLNTDLPKDLGTVATFLAPDQPRWKHLSDSKPAFYNAVDSDVALRCTLRAFEELKAAGLWHVYERHVQRFDRITARMSKKGMPLDQGRRLEYAKRIHLTREELQAALEQVVPFELRPKFVYKNHPRDRIVLVELST